MKSIIAIVGKSGSGKTTIIEHLAKTDKVHVLESYTTRPKRSDDETGHIFISDGEAVALLKTGMPFDPQKDNVLAYNEIGGYKYFALESQIHESKPTLYVVDPVGVMRLNDYLQGRIPLLIIYLHTEQFESMDRLMASGYSMEQALERMGRDAECECAMLCDCIIPTTQRSLTDVIADVKLYISLWIAAEKTNEAKAKIHIPTTGEIFGVMQK